ncbi:MAG: matrixin family metalloprotease [Blastocatellia bacterium]
MFFRKATLTLSLVYLLAAFNVASATSVIIPSDDEMIIGARAIVRGQVVSIGSQLDPERNIVFTYITLRIQEVFKGKIAIGEIIIKEPGGVVGARGSMIFGTPEFKAGEDVLLFLDTWADGSLRVYNWFLGKYSVVNSPRTGKLTVARDATNGRVSVLGRSQNGPITDNADFAEFGSMLRARVSATKAAAAQHEAKYFGAIAVKDRPQEIAGGGLGPAPNFTFINPSRPPRWFEPDTNQSVVFRINPSGAPNGTIINDVSAALNAWSNVSGSALRISNGGSTGNCGLLVLDGENTVSFNNCDNYSPFSPPSGGCSGILAAAGIVSYNPYQTRIVNGITFYRAIEANVSFNPYASCHFSNSCNVQEIATHELGHALGIGHSLDSAATMYAYAHFDGRCAGLRSDDQSAVQFIYPGGGSTTNPLSVTTTSLPDAQLANYYTQVFNATGGVPGYNWSISAGALPAGLTLSVYGIISGTPTQAGSFPLTVMVRDSVNSVSTKNFTLVTNSTCSYSVSPSTFTIPASGGSGTVNVAATAGCSWYSNNGNSWITVQASSGTGNGAVIFTAAPNPAPSSPRSGTITVAGQTVTVSQNGQAGAVTQGLQYYPLPYPIRLLETRAGYPGCTTTYAPIQGRTSHTQNARMTCSGITIPASAQAITGNLTINNSNAAGGYGTIYPTGNSVPLASNVNYTAYSTVGNSFTTGLNSSGQFSVYLLTTADAQIDITGYFAPPGAGGLYYHPLPRPIRLLDTRAGQSACDAPGAPLQAQTQYVKNAWGTCSGLTIPANARAIAGNFTVVNHSANYGFGILYPAGYSVPQTYSVNYNPNRATNGSIISGLSSSGQFTLYTFSTVHAVLDVSGYFSTDAVDVNGVGLLYQPLSAPLRLLDTRAGYQACDTPGQALPTQIPRTETAWLTCNGLTIPNTAKAITGNFTVVNQTANQGYGTLYSANTSTPNVSNINFVPNEIRGNSFITGLSAAGQFNAYVLTSVHAVIDVTGYFVP